MNITSQPNIFFVIEDVLAYKNDILLDNYNNIQQLQDEMNIQINANLNENECDNYSTLYYYYDTQTVKELLKICNYYDIVKNCKNCKNNKHELINSIVWFESAIENCEVVHQRNKMWSYIIELGLDSKMKKYLLWV